MSADQIIIGVGGLASLWLSQDARPRVARWACLFGLAAQPAWFYTAYHAEQWGIFALTFAYIAGWSRGVWNFWIKPSFVKP
jgi:hypothetical protein